MPHFEVEIKSLLGDEAVARAFRTQLASLFPHLIFQGKHSQLNHYFTDGDVSLSADRFNAYFTSEQQTNLKRILTEGKKHSIRTRQADGRVLLVVKASIDDTSSANGIIRMEFEEAPESLSLDALDDLLLDMGLQYQAKWSRDREEYRLRDVSICLDRNAGYGYVVEFEKVVSTEDEVTQAKAELIDLMRHMDIVELSQERLGRMFAFYNAHWREYYGTDRVFTIE